MAGRDAKKQIFMTVALALFGASTLFSAVRLLSASAPQPTPEPTPVSETAALESQAKGYELVLQREPNNITALEGLAMTRLQLRDIQAAVPLLEKLVKLNPDRSDVAALLAETKRQPIAPQ